MIHSYIPQKERGMSRHIACLVFTLLILTGCSDSNVEVVKNGTMFEYPNTTVGKAFEASFANAKWESKTSEKGAITVHFRGTITQKTHDSAAAYLIDDYKGLNFNGERTTPLSNSVSFARNILIQYMGRSEFERRTRDEHAAFDAALKNDRVDGNRDTREARREAEKALDIATVNCYLDFIASEFWPVGSPVEFVWVLSHDKKGFELSSLSNDSWMKFGLRSDQVIKTIYTE
jgi:hypothetical protein